MAATTSDSQEGTASSSRSAFKRYWWIYLLVLLLLVLVAGGFILFITKGSLLFGKNNWIFLGYPDSNREVDLSILRYGQKEEDARSLAKNAVQSRVLLLTSQTTNMLLIADSDSEMYPSFMSFLEAQAPRLGNYQYDFGGFDPRSRYLMYWYKDDDETSLHRIVPGDDESALLFETESYMTSGDIFSTTEVIFLAETRDDKLRCYISVMGQEAERFGKGATCGITLDGLQLYVAETSADDETSIEIMDLSGEAQKPLLDHARGIVDYKFSYAGSRLAYVQKEAEQFRLITLDSATGEAVFESEPYVSIVDYNFSKEGDSFFYIGEVADGELQLFTIDASGERKIASGYTLRARLSRDGKYLIYLVGDEDQEYTLYSYDLLAASKARILDGNAIVFGVLDGPDSIIIRQMDDGELILSGAGIDGQSVTQLYSEDDVSVDLAAFVPEENLLYLYLEKDGKESLFVTPLDKEAGELLIEDWEDIRVLNRSLETGQVLLTGREEEDDDPALYSAALTDASSLEKLDGNADGFSNAVFSPNSKDVIYTAQTGEDPDEVEVRLAPVDGSERGKAIYEEAFLIDTQWAALEPFLYISWLEPLSGTSYCPGAPSLALGEEIKGSLGSQQKDCFRLQLEDNQLLTFTKVNTSLEMFDRTGTLLFSEDDSSPENNLLFRTPVIEPGTYYLVVKAGVAAEYTLQAKTGTGYPIFDKATQLVPGSPIRGAVTSSSYLEINTQNYSSTTYGNMYYFDGHKGDKIQIDVLSYSLGSNLDSVAILFDPLIQKIAEDDDGGEGRDSRITYTLGRDGRYFVLVKGVGTSYGSSSEYFYDILLTVK